MRTYLISYDLAKPTRNQHVLAQVIMGLGEKWARPLSNTWYVHPNATRPNSRAELKDLLGEEDGLLIQAVKREAIMTNTSIRWFRQRRAGVDILPTATSSPSRCRRPPSRRNRNCLSPRPAEDFASAAGLALSPLDPPQTRSTPHKSRGPVPADPGSFLPRYHVRFWLRLYVSSCVSCRVPVAWRPSLPRPLPPIAPEPRNAPHENLSHSSPPPPPTRTPGPSRSRCPTSRPYARAGDGLWYVKTWLSAEQIKQAPRDPVQRPGRTADPGFRPRRRLDQCIVAWLEGRLEDEEPVTLSLSAGPRAAFAAVQALVQDLTRPFSATMFARRYGVHVRKLARSLRPSVWLFSGWNCVPAMLPWRPLPSPARRSPSPRRRRADRLPRDETNARNRRAGLVGPSVCRRAARAGVRRRACSSPCAGSSKPGRWVRWRAPRP